MANIIMGVLHNNGGGGECWPGPARAWGLASVQRSTPTAREDAFHCLVSEGALWMTPLAWGGGGGAPCVRAGGVRCAPRAIA